MPLHQFNWTGCRIYGLHDDQPSKCSPCSQWKTMSVCICHDGLPLLLAMIQAVLDSQWSWCSLWELTYSCLAGFQGVLPLIRHAPGWLLLSRCSATCKRKLIKLIQSLCYPHLLELDKIVTCLSSMGTLQSLLLCLCHLWAGALHGVHCIIHHDICAEYNTNIVEWGQPCAVLAALQNCWSAQWW